MGLEKHLTVLLDLKPTVHKATGSAGGGGTYGFEPTGAMLGTTGQSLAGAFASTLANHAKSVGAATEDFRGLGHDANMEGLRRLKGAPTQGLGDIAKSFFKDATGGKGLGGAFSEAIKSLGAKGGGSAAMGILGGEMGGGAGALGGALGGPAGIAIGVAVDQLSKLPGVFMDMTSKIAGFVKAFNPMAVDRFQLALDDLTATFGEALMPSLELATGTVRSIADFIIGSGLAESVTSIMGDLNDVFKELQPEIMLLVGAMGMMVGPAKMLSVALNLALAPLIPLNNMLRSLGILGVGAGSSFGKSAQQASFTGVEEFGKQAAQAAMSAGGKSHAETTAEGVTQLVKSVNDILTAIKTTGTKANQVAKVGLGLAGGIGLGQLLVPQVFE